MRPIERLIRAERAHQRGLLARGALLAGLVAASSVALLGLSGWFITAAATAGAAGILAAQGFNYMLPSATIRLLAIVRTGARYGERLASHEAAFSALARIRPALFAAIAAAPITRTLAITSGDATARVTQDVDRIEARFVRLSAPWGAASSLIAGGALIAPGGWAAALTVLLLFAATLLAARLLAHRLAGPGRRAQHAIGALKTEVASLAGASAELRCYGLEGWAADQIAERSRELAGAQRAQAIVAGWFDLCQPIGIALAAVAAAALSAGHGAAIAALAALAGAMTLDGITPLLRDLAERGAVDEATGRLDAILSDPAPARTWTDARIDAWAHAEGDVGAGSLPMIEFARDDFRWLRAGSRILIEGPSGIGKTTLIESLIGLRPAERGHILVDGVDLADLPCGTLRRLFGWAPQDAMLLAGTVRENLLLARPDADEASLWAALHDAALDGRVKALPLGLDGWIGENGARLSGGERRRLSLARACLSAAPFLLLDEPAEGLDAATEALVTERLAARLERTGQGLLLVSHRHRLTTLCGEVIRLGGKAEPAPGCPRARELA
ncbi:amino acid ABC transporter ATP-binding/permease protein [Sphingomonas sp.]|uniref:amino acid ABC transporter ATP-binding/permease protein n=1 Tax=Sphingomonas sp. TaxID=28214 RepID=UPI000DB7DF3F|nr:ATP-binding cassette domain-containing protein [Sphingomonas sp.]PZU10720.1 MAG: cysteine ABC transporter permease [Sphingomonas sp.]